MVITFDMDDVLVSFQKGWAEFNNLRYKTSLTYESFTDFDYTKVMNLSKEEVFKRIFEFYESDMLQALQPVEGAIETVRQLSEKHDLYVLTSRSLEIKNKTEACLDRYFPNMFKEVLYTGQISREGMNHTITKAEMCLKYKSDLHVDDAPLHVNQLVEQGIKVAVLETPWNRNVSIENPLAIRIKSIKEVCDLI